jgi:hypothetical protein
MEGVFFKPKSEYTNVLNPVKGYLDQLTQYIATKKAMPSEEARVIATRIVKANFKDQDVKYFERQENGDREVRDGKLYRYIKHNLDEKNVLAPTFTSYKPTKVDKSILSEFIFVNVKKRSVAKKAGQKAKADGNLELAISKNNEQNMMKIYNNSLSGVFGQEACILYNPTAHNTLTTVTRTITSLSNASNEKLIAGNVYLPRPIDVLNNIVYVSTYVDQGKVKETVEKYNLYLPTVEDVVSVLKYSSDLYFSDRAYYIDNVIPYLQKLNPYQLAGICYSGYLYHLRRFNEGFIRELVRELIEPVETTQAKLEDVSVMYEVDEAILNYVHTIFFSKVKGYGKDYARMNDSGVASGLLETSKHVVSTLKKYKQLFNTFFMTELIPINSHRLSNLRRRTVVISDTDSTCFTLDEWVTWYKNGYIVDDESIALAGLITYIASQAIVNSLAILSKNMNVDEELLFTLAMKSEYLWQAMVPTTVSKHYFASTIMQEGSVFKDPETEIKGQVLKNSAVPKLIMDKGTAMMKTILSTVSSGKKIKLNDILREIISAEEEIVRSVQRGEGIYLRKNKVKSKEAYSQDEMRSPYQRHQFWVDVFEPKYGSIGETPYDVVKIPTLIKSRPLLTDWINSIEDVELSGRLVKWLEAYGKKDLPTIYLNETYLIGNGIPKEIYNIINLKQIIFDMTLQYRTILECLGVLLNDEMLIGEQFSV